MVRGVTEYDCMLTSPELDIDADEYTVVEFRVRSSVTGKGEIFWHQEGKRFSDERQKDHALYASEEPRVYRSRVATVETWRGTIRRIRLDILNAAGAEVALDYVRITTAPRSMVANAGFEDDFDSDGVPDGWQVDAIYSGTQKCLSCPPGLAPVSLSPRVVDALEARRHPVPSWYLDMSMVRHYWGSDRTYHHTAPISMIYALRQALQVVMDEGLEARFARHQRNSAALVAGLEALGLEMLVEEPYRLPMLNAVEIPEGVDDAAVRGALLEEHGIEIGGGLGPLAGSVWRIGLMGHSCSMENVLMLLEALVDILDAQGFAPGTGARQAAEEAHAESGA
jgi:hypothetical protein